MVELIQRVSDEYYFTVKTVDKKRTHAHSQKHLCRVCKRTRHERKRNSEMSEKKVRKRENDKRALNESNWRGANKRDKLHRDSRRTNKQERKTKKKDKV